MPLIVEQGLLLDFSDFIINGDSDCGYLAKSVDGWYNAN